LNPSRRSGELPLQARELLHEAGHALPLVSPRACFLDAVLDEDRERQSGITPDMELAVLPERQPVQALVEEILVVPLPEHGPLLPGVEERRAEIGVPPGGLHAILKRGSSPDPFR
jgi:hypothetical protein